MQPHWSAFAEAGRNVSRGISAICNLIFRKGMIDVDFAHLRKAFGGRAGGHFLDMVRGLERMVYGKQ